MVGGRIALHLAPTFDVVAGKHRGPTPEGVPEVALDLLSPSALERSFETLRPDAVIHAAALADPDRCEEDPTLAEALNVGATETLARLCAARRARFVMLSTDLVFGGDHAPYRESDPPRPLSVYARTKVAAELALQSRLAGAAILRISLVIGEGYGPKPSATEALVRKLADNQTVRLFRDQHRTPLDPGSIADAVARVLSTDAAGLFHLGGSERVSRYELGQRVAEAFGFPSALVEPAVKAELPQRAPRPADVSLDCSRAHAVLGWTARPLADAIRESRRI
jgi:dTDP-4-dehydrorhamnose reductase